MLAPVATVVIMPRSSFRQRGCTPYAVHAAVTAYDPTMLRRGSRATASRLVVMPAPVPEDCQSSHTKARQIGRLRVTMRRRNRKLAIVYAGLRDLRRPVRAFRHDKRGRTVNGNSCAHIFHVSLLDFPCDMAPSARLISSSHVALGSCARNPRTTEAASRLANPSCWHARTASSTVVSGALS